MRYAYTVDLHYSLSRLPNPDTSPEADPTDDSDVDYAEHPMHPAIHPDDYTYVDIMDGGGDYLTLTFSGYAEGRYTFLPADSLGDDVWHDVEPCACDDEDHATDDERLACALRQLTEDGHDNGSTFYFEPDDSPLGYGHGDPVSASVAIHLDPEAADLLGRLRERVA